MTVQAEIDLGSDENEEQEEVVEKEEKLVPMPESSGIEALRKKLHIRMAELRNRGQSGEPGDRDELLEERRKQRANMRERRRKETKEKIKREEETRGKKNKEKREEKQKGNSTRVRYSVHSRADDDDDDNNVLRHSYWYPIPQSNYTAQVLKQSSQTSHSAISSANPPPKKLNDSKLHQTLNKPSHNSARTKQNYQPCQSKNANPSKKKKNGTRQKRVLRERKSETTKRG